MSYTYLDLAKEVLIDSQTPLRLGEIWKRAKEKGLQDKLENSFSPLKQTLSRALHDDIRRNRAGIFAISKNPTLFGLEGKHDKEYQPSEETPKKQVSFKERDLHPLFVRFARDKLGIACKTIRHERSAKDKKGKSEWLHPDIVGVKFACEKKETLGLLKTLAYPKVELYAFELKIFVGFHNFKKSYFQAVSNASWADYGYLAVFGIDDDEELLDELKKLNARFGIGILYFGRDDNQFEKFFIPAKPKEKIDISMIDELIAKGNEDFKNFIKQVKIDAEKEKIESSQEGYDEVYDDERLESYIKTHNITYEE